MMYPARCLILLLIALLALPVAAFAQDDDTREARRKALLEGTHVLRRILFDEGMTALEDFDDLSEKPGRNLLIVLGDLDVLGLVELKRFVRSGGAVLVASDRPPTRQAGLTQLLSLAGVSISPGTLTCPDPEFCYRGVDYCPFVEGSEKTIPPLFASLRVATNVPAMLISSGPRGESIESIANLPSGSVVHLRRGQHRLRFPLFAVAGEVEEGRVLVMADHSVFINEMMLPSDNSNVEFATKAITWLRGEGQARDRVLFVEDGRIETKLEIPLKSVTISPEDALKLVYARRNEILATSNAVLARLEDEAAFDNHLLAFLIRIGLPPWQLARVALIVGTLFVGCFVLFRLGTTRRFRHDPTVPLLAPSIDRLLPVFALAEQRQQALLKAGNLAEPAMNLARNWFAHLGVAQWSGALPPISVRGGWWKRRRLLARLGKIWRQAGGLNQRVGSRELQALERDLADLRRAHERGEWRLAAGLIEAPAHGRVDE